jgi:hypothetical protein
MQCLLRSSKEAALRSLKEGLQVVSVPGTDWDTTGALQATASSIDAHINSLRTKKVPCPS